MQDRHDILNNNSIWTQLGDSQQLRSECAKWLVSFSGQPKLINSLLADPRLWRTLAATQHQCWLQYPGPHLLRQILAPVCTLHSQLPELHACRTSTAPLHALQSLQECGAEHS